MCVNKETSLAVFLLGITSAAYVVRRKTPRAYFVATVLAVIAVMQLLEMFIWMDPEGGTMNRVASLMIPVVLALQPIICLFLIRRLGGKALPPHHQRLIWVLSGAIVAAGATFFYLTWRAGYVTSHKDPDSCRLVWSPIRILFEETNLTGLLVGAYVIGFGYVLYLARTVLGLSSVEGYGMTFAVLCVSLFYSYMYHKQRFYLIWGSVWCFLVVIAGLGSVFQK